MARYKPVEKGQGYFLTICPEAIFEENSIEKTIDRFIDDFVDIREFDSKYKNDTYGQKAISPLVMLKVIIYGLSQGIEKMRRIEKMLQLSHPGFLLLSGGRTIDHSTLCNFLNKFSDKISDIFGRLLYVMEELKLIDWGKIMIDGTLISSNASKEFSRDAKGFKEKMEHYEKLSVKLLERAEYVSEQEESGKIDSQEKKEEMRKIKKQQKKYDQVLEKIKIYKEEVQAGNLCPDKKINLTDKTSSLLSKGETFLQGYNIQSAYSNNDILLEIDPADNGNDKACLSPMIEKVETLKKN